MNSKLLLIDDDINILTTLQMRLESQGHQVLVAENGGQGLAICESEVPDLVLLDLRLPGMDGLETLERIKEANPWSEVIMLTAAGSIETAVQAMKIGAFDYLPKPIDSKQLKSLIEKALKKAEASCEIRRFRKQYKTLGAFGSILGTSSCMQQIFRLIEQVSQTRATVLITGESGTGKELVAGTIHALSPRQGSSFTVLNCSAIPSTLWESEVFGHEKGAFTGAEARKAGCFELANGGSLFLDEVSEMPIASQAKLLRVLEDHRFRRVGGTEEVLVDVRMIAASNRNLLKAIAEKQFRQDLYYRLNHFVIELPPLRERKEDIPLLAQAFLADTAARHDQALHSLTQQSLELLQTYSWPGNIRELRNVIERSAILCQGAEIGADCIRDSLTDTPTNPNLVTLSVGTPIEEAERVLIQKTLRSTGGNKAKAARLLGISLKTFYNKLLKYSRVKEGGPTS